MRVLLDATFSRHAPRSGTAIYLECLRAELERLPGVTIETTVNERRRAPAGGGPGSVRNLLGDRWWLASELPRRARSLKADVIHHPLPALARTTDAAQVVTVHDLAFERLPAHFAHGYRAYSRRAHRTATRSADAVVCVSETTSADVRSLWRVSEARIVVAPHGPGQPLPAPAAELPRTHFLYVGDAEPRKNLGMLLEAYAAYRRKAADPCELVLAGSATAAGDGVRAEPAPSPSRLAELYAGAIALVHPSLYEGFGFTPLEAMSLGTPVIALRSPGVLEVCADAAQYVEPATAEQLTRAMAALAESHERWHERSARGRVRARAFSWAASARAHEAAYSLALEHR